MDGCMVDFKIPGMIDNPGRGPDGQRVGVFDAVIDMNEFDRKTADADNVAITDINQLSVTDARARSSILRRISSIVRWLL
jgi:hypothetical protein